MKLEIRKAAAEDAEKIHSIYASRIGAEGCTWDDEYPSLKLVEKDISEGSVYVAECGGKIAAAAVCGKDTDFDVLNKWSEDIKNPAALERVGVLEEYEGKHVASALIEYIINDIAKQGFDGIRLLVFGGNRRAEGLYIKKGFLHTGEAFGWGTLWQCYEIKLGNNDGKTEGTVVSSKECRWLKINTKPVRSHSLDGAVFPHIITVKYTVNGKEYLKKKYVSYKLPCPKTGDRLTVLYDNSRPEKAKVIL